MVSTLGRTKSKVDKRKGIIVYQLYIMSDRRFMYHGTYENKSDAETAGQHTVKYFESVTEYFVVGDKQ